VIVTIGVLTLLVASAAVYGILTINTQIQANPQQTKIPDYTAELDSLKSQVSSMNSQIDSISSSVAVLDTLKNNVAAIQVKLTDIENKDTQIAQTASSTASLALVLDKAAYSPGDSIKITAIGASAVKSIQVELLDNDGFVLVHKDTWADSTGKVSYSLQLPSSILAGNYKVQIVSDQQTQSQPITIGAPSTSQTTSSSNSFTAQTDKSVYQRGDLVQVTGTGTAGTAVNAVMTSPSGKTYTSTVTIQADGSYVMIFSTFSSDEIGQWNITVTNLGQTKTLSVYVGSGSSSSNSFTAQTDKSVYQRGDLVQVTGTGTAGTSVSGVLSGPTGKTYNTSTTIRSDGSYVLIFSTIAADQTGQWTVTVTNLGLTKTLSIYIQ
jgi:hypothetical protein